MQNTTTYYRVVVSDPVAWDKAGYDALYGREPRVFATREDAEAHAEALAEAWPEDDRPAYEVEVIDAETAAETAYGIA